MQQLLAIAKALGDETRMRALAALQGRELCLCQITELLQLAPSTLSKHLFLLRQAGLIRARKEGRWMHYRWIGREASAEARQALHWVHAFLAGAPELAADRERLEAILKVDREVLCERQRRKC